MLAVLVTTNRNTFDWVLIVAAALFFVSALLHFMQPAMAFLALAIGMLGATALAIALMFL